jgi:hypothetical protein
MNRTAAIAIIKRGLGFRQTQDTAIISALQQVQRDLEGGKTLPNWMLVFDAPIVVTSGTALATLPAGFLRFHEDYPPYYINSSGGSVTVTRKTDDEAHAAYPTVTPPSGSYPSVFVLRKKTTIEFVPKPMTSFTAYLTYYKAGLVLDSDIENVWLANAANYIIGLAGMMVAGDVRDKGAMDKFSMMTKMGAASYMGDIVEDELAGRPLIMGRNN